jgi:Putative amidase domain
MRNLETKILAFAFLGVLGLSSCQKSEELQDVQPVEETKSSDRGARIAATKQKKVYSSSNAVTYAKKYYDSYSQTACPSFIDYGKSSEFGESSNCTNFVNQAILAGITQQATPDKVYAGLDFNSFTYDSKWFYRKIRDTKGNFYMKTVNFKIDSKTTTTKFSYWAHDSGSAWRGAKQFQDYASSHKWEGKTTDPTSTGLYFKGIANDDNTTTYPTTFNQIQAGDIVCVKYKSSNDFGHVLIVTGIDTRYSDYRRILVSSQQDDYVDNSMETRRVKNIQNGGKGLMFYVYRPLFYIYFQ